MAIPFYATQRAGRGFGANTTPNLMAGLNTFNDLYQNKLATDQMQLQNLQNQRNFYGTLFSPLPTANQVMQQQQPPPMMNPQQAVPPMGIPQPMQQAAPPQQPMLSTMPGNLNQPVMMPQVNPTTASAQGTLTTQQMPFNQYSLNNQNTAFMNPYMANKMTW